MGTLWNSHCANVNTLSVLGIKEFFKLTVKEYFGRHEQNWWSFFPFFRFKTDGGRAISWQFSRKKFRFSRTNNKNTISSYCINIFSKSADENKQIKQLLDNDCDFESEAEALRNISVQF